MSEQSIEQSFRDRWVQAVGRGLAKCAGMLIVFGPALLIMKLTGMLDSAPFLSGLLIGSFLADWQRTTEW